MISFSFDIVFFRDIRSDGNKTKFDNIAIKRVKETKPPKATVPPNSEIMNTENPKNSTTDE